MLLSAAVPLSATACRTMKRARAASSSCRGSSGAVVGAGVRFALARIPVEVTVIVLVDVTRGYAVEVTISEESMTVVTLSVF